MYIVLEIQYNQTDNTVSTLVNSYDDINQAEWKYHQVLSAAAISQIDVHSAVLMDQYGYLIKGEHYNHKSQDLVTEA